MVALLVAASPGSYGGLIESTRLSDAEEVLNPLPTPNCGDQYRKLTIACRILSAVAFPGARIRRRPGVREEGHSAEIA
jgi:hypothetical protein